MGRLRNWLFPPERSSERALAVTSEQPRPVEHAEINPAMLRLQRSLAAVAAEPVGSSDEGLTPLAMGVIVQWMETAYAAGQMTPIWECRVRYGYGVGQGEASREQWFWFNAYPALAALRLEKRDYPFVATSCGLADQARDYGAPRQAKVQHEFETLLLALDAPFCQSRTPLKQL